MITILLIINIVLFIILVGGLIHLSKYIDEVCNAVIKDNHKQIINQFNKNVADILTILKLNDTLLKSNHTNINTLNAMIREQTNKLSFINEDVQNNIDVVKNLITDREINMYNKNKNKHRNHKNFVKKQVTPINDGKGIDFDVDNLKQA